MGREILIDLVCGFVEKSGGITKVKEMGDALRGMAEIRFKGWECAEEE